ncbi:hypothetical protein SELMODRAFT_422922 [Selaginella moellendorffii]|uniref:Xyloglucan endotransglucosylase/hydrolase n=1 Tax=Selaginella moellendorffii TaxID=88036 RepID=D8SJZ7_SELML|nr:probable xyloglucan endotransglucosylase/hydrolase protein 5 [Selaginella moellendorffii]EFJ15245.1 hypothetical protein SELMODRAFT_422922 [Selaginella moellendorffii]|eukprot:XP_002983749.1 probable xyloglucan endotransglucosylase/hydrolase protein 5 [Selaginella moellendorffii]
MATDPADTRKQWLLSRDECRCCCSSTRPKILLSIAALALLVTAAVVIGASVGATRASARNHRHKKSSNAATFDENYNISWSGDHVRLLNGGLLADILLDKQSGAEFGSKRSYLFGHLKMQMKLVANDSAGTVTAFYMASHTENRDEFDFEFLGNRSGQPYALQTNIYVNGTGGREQRILLWFDPSLDYHTYSVLWNQYQVIFFVDDTPVRVFRNNSHLGVPYAFSQPMRIFGSMWNGEQWATVGGLEKTNWNYAPFIASFQDFAIDGCDPSSSPGDPGFCFSSGNRNHWWDEEKYRVLDVGQLDNLGSIVRNYTIYDYCTDTKRYSPVPPECGANP